MLETSNLKELPEDLSKLLDQGIGDPSSVIVDTPQYFILHHLKKNLLQYINEKNLNLEAAYSFVRSINILLSQLQRPEAPPPPKGRLTYAFLESKEYQDYFNSEAYQDYLKKLDIYQKQSKKLAQSIQQFIQVQDALLELNNQIEKYVADGKLDRDSIRKEMSDLRSNIPHSIEANTDFSPHLENIEKFQKKLIGSLLNKIIDHLPEGKLKNHLKKVKTQVIKDLNAGNITEETAHSIIGAIEKLTKPKPIKIFDTSSSSYLTQQLNQHLDYDAIDMFPNNIDPTSEMGQCLNEFLKKIIASAPDQKFDEQFNKKFDAALNRIPLETVEGKKFHDALLAIKEQIAKDLKSGKLTKEAAISVAISIDKFSKIMTRPFKSTPGSETFRADVRLRQKAIKQFRDETSMMPKNLIILFTMAITTGAGFLIAGPAGAAVGMLLGLQASVYLTKDKKEIKETKQTGLAFLTSKVLKQHMGRPAFRNDSAMKKAMGRRKEK